MIPYIDNLETNSSFCMGFGPMGQNTRSVSVWDYAVKQLKPSTVIELGTGPGAFTCCLGIICKNYNIQLHTFDCFLEPPRRDWFEYLGVHFHSGDIFTTAGAEYIRSLIETSGTVFLLCDNGNKPREWNRFAPYLKPGDLIAAHDYRVDPGSAWPYTQITEEDVAYQSDLLGLEPFLQSDFNETGWLVKRKRYETVQP